MCVFVKKRGINSLGLNHSEGEKRERFRYWAGGPGFTFSHSYDTFDCLMTLGQKKKNVYVALSRPTVKCEKTGSVFFFFFFFKCQIWAKNLLKFVFNGLKKHLHDFYGSEF